MEKTDEKIKQTITGSVLGKPQEGNYALFKDAKFYLRGDYQLNGVYYSQRDMNGNDGNIILNGLDDRTINVGIAS